ncbi:uncharacterized protein LOC128663449 [Bombina bombina]|uniref:uncharacterized protein LOC128663449 n=1 Tax=Bombina bombina TaxID=8345 RepID=UPI00235AEFFA|nr:uncharacterized protein LOC128663449 [Bombina bombina]XP_053573753.1 uncharacterized protein LOC128663449 [Bombina bombina]
MRLMKNQHETGGPIQESDLWLQNVISYWEVPKDITYATPPYISLREDFELQYKPFVPERYFLDMLNKFDSKDLSYISFQEDNNRFEGGNEVYKKETSQESPIRDTLNKWIVLEHNKLLAKELQGPTENKAATIKITYYKPMKDEKQPLTLQIKGTNLYVVNQSGKLQLEAINEPDLSSINSDKMKFLFLLTNTSGSYKSFETATDPEKFISTSQKSASVVTIQPSSDQTKLKEFLITSNLFRIFLNAGHKRISLRTPRMETILKNSQNRFSTMNNRGFQFNIQKPIHYWQRPFICM